MVESACETAASKTSSSSINRFFVFEELEPTAEESAVDKEGELDCEEVEATEGGDVRGRLDEKTGSVSLSESWLHLIELHQ